MIKKLETNEELETLARLAKKIWNDYFIQIISQDQIDYMVENFQSYSAIKDAVENQGYEYLLIYHEDIMAGYAGIKLEEERLFLSKFYLDSTFRGKGLGSQLMKEIKSIALEKNKKIIYLTCNKYNKDTLDIYAHYGFKIIDDVKSDIGHGFIMDDFILELAL